MFAVAEATARSPFAITQAEIIVLAVTTILLVVFFAYVIHADTKDAA